MSKPKITTEKIREIRDNQNAARRAGAPTAMARIAKSMVLLEAPARQSLPSTASATSLVERTAPTALLEQPATELLLPATVEEQSTITAPSGPSPLDMPKSKPAHTTVTRRPIERGSYSTESPDYQIPVRRDHPVGVEGRDITTLPAAELTEAEREREIARLAAEQKADDDTTRPIVSNQYPSPLDPETGHQLTEELRAYERDKKRRQQDPDGVVPFDTNDYGPDSSDDQYPLSRIGMHIIK